MFYFKKTKMAGDRGGDSKVGFCKNTYSQALVLTSTKLTFVLLNEITWVKCLS